MHTICSNLRGFSKTISPILSESDCNLLQNFKCAKYACFNSICVEVFSVFVFFLLFLFVPVYHFVLHLWECLVN